MAFSRSTAFFAATATPSKNIVTTGTDPGSPGAWRCAGAHPKPPGQIEDESDDLRLAFVILLLNG